MPSNITICGLGPGPVEWMSLGALRALETSQHTYLRTRVHPTAAALEERALRFASFDSLYESSKRFEDVYEAIVHTLVANAKAYGRVTYAVPGHPMVGEATVRHLLEAAPLHEVRVEVIPSMSCLDAIAAALHSDPSQGWSVYDALDGAPRRLADGQTHVFLQVYNRLIASELKLKLLDVLPPDHPCSLVRHAGQPGAEQVLEIPLHRIDADWQHDHLTSLVVPPSPDPAHPLDRLTAVMATLRGDNGCPWDREQTHRTLLPYLIEEAYEVVEAVEAGDDEALCEELGDVLLQVVFHAQLASERGQFQIDDSVAAITEKMIRRHPHVFGSTTADTPDDVLRNWEAIKRQEKSDANGNEPASLLDGVARHLPALSYAQEVGKRAAKVGFDWPDIDGVWAKILEELEELAAARRAAPSPSNNAVAEEWGDLIFALVNLARHLGLDPELAAHQAASKFERRFRTIEALAQRAGRSLAAMSQGEMEALWEEAKSSAGP